MRAIINARCPPWSEIDQKRSGNLSSAIRVYVFGHLCTQTPGGARDTVAPGAVNSPLERRETPSH